VVVAYGARLRGATFSLERFVQQYWKKLLRSYVVEAWRGLATASGFPRKTLENFLRRLNGRIHEEKRQNRAFIAGAK